MTLSDQNGPVDNVERITTKTTTTTTITFITVVISITILCLLNDVVVHVPQ